MLWQWYHSRPSSRDQAARGQVPRRHRGWRREHRCIFHVGGGYWSIWLGIRHLWLEAAASRSAGGRHYPLQLSVLRLERLVFNCHRHRLHRPAIRCSHLNEGPRLASGCRQHGSMPTAPVSSPMARDPERQRLDEDDARKRNWKRWGPYLSARQWGTGSRGIPSSLGRATSARPCRGAGSPRFARFRTAAT